MAKKSKSNNSIDREQLPQGISPEDWAKTPVSVRKLITLLSESKREYIKNPKNQFPFVITLLINLVIVVIFANYLDGKVTFRCITPHQVSPLSVAIISLIPLHLIWRNIYAFVPPNLEETIKLGAITIPLKALITLFNEMQIWKFPSRLLGLVFPFLLISGIYLNLSHNSPFYTDDEFSAIQGFSVQRFDKKIPEFLPVGGRLKMTTNEKVFVEAVFRSKAETTCTWYSALSSENHKTGCFIVLDEPSNTDIDNLTVRIESACGTQSFAGLHVAIQP